MSNVAAAGFQIDVSQTTSYIKSIQIERCPKPKLVAKCTLVSLPRRGVSDWTLFKTEVSRTVRLGSKSKASYCTLHKPKLVAKCALVSRPRVGAQIVRCYRPSWVAQCAFVFLPRGGFQIARCPKPKLVAKCALISGPKLEASNVGIGSGSLTGQPFRFHVVRGET